MSFDDIKYYFILINVPNNYNYDSIYNIIPYTYTIYIKNTIYMVNDNTKFYRSSYSFIDSKTVYQYDAETTY